MDKRDTRIGVNEHGIYEDLDKYGRDTDITRETRLIGRASGIGEDLSTEDGTRLKSEENVRRLRKFFKEKKVTGRVLTDKVKKDTGVIAVYGDRQSGVSGVVSNLAEVYASVKRRVLVIDLDIETRHQSAYFPIYEERAKNFRGIVNGLIKTAQGGGVDRGAVEITQRISVLGMGRNENYNPDHHKLLYRRLIEIITESLDYYDIIILDIPHNRTKEYLEVTSGVIDNYLMVVSDLRYRNHIYFKTKLRNFIREDIGLVTDVFEKTMVIVNRVHPDHIYSNKYTHDNGEFRIWLRQLGHPYTQLRVVGELPEYKEWEIQYGTNIRYVWLDKLAMYSFVDIANRLFLTR